MAGNWWKSNMATTCAPCMLLLYMFSRSVGFLWLNSLMPYIYMVVIIVRVNLTDEYWKDVYIFYLLNSILKSVHSCML